MGVAYHAPVITCNPSGVPRHCIYLVKRESIFLLSTGARGASLDVVLHRVLVEVVSGHVQPPVVLCEAVDGCVIVCAGDGHELAHFGSLRLLQFVLHNEQCYCR